MIYIKKIKLLIASIRMKIEEIRLIQKPSLKIESYQRALIKMNKALGDFPDIHKDPLFYFYRGLIQGGLGNLPGMSEEIRLFKEKAKQADPKGFKDLLKRAEELEERIRILQSISWEQTQIQNPSLGLPYTPFEIAV